MNNDTKATLRAHFRALRQTASSSEPGAADKAAEIFLDKIVLPSGGTVAAYCAQEDEIDPFPLVEKLAKRGLRLCLPVISDPTRPLFFRAWKLDDTLCEGPLGILEPAPDQPFRTPDLMIVPLIAFDNEGNRLGQGGGYYDRTLRDLRARKTVQAIGYAFACQEALSLPSDSTDQPLDGVVTPLGARSFIHHA